MLDVYALGQHGQSLWNGSENRMSVQLTRKTASSTFSEHFCRHDFSSRRMNAGFSSNDSANEFQRSALICFPLSLQGQLSLLMRGLVSLEPFGRPILLVNLSNASVLDGSKNKVSLYHVRPIQISRTVFAVTLNSFANAAVLISRKE